MSFDVTTKTAQDIIKRSLRLSTILGSGDPLPDDEATDAMLSFNGMLDSWGAERLMVYELVEESFTWPASTTSRTIGSSGDFDTVRPIKIDSAFTRDSASNDTPLRIIEVNAYNTIELKLLEGSMYPDFLYYDPSYPLGTLKLVYTPDSATTLHLSSVKGFTQLAALTTTVAFPPGYYDAFCYGLSVRLCPEYGKVPTPEVKDMAAQLKRTLKGVNGPTLVARLDAGVAPPRHTNIFEG